jgi:tRNA(Ile)-lysidine synthase
VDAPERLVEVVRRCLRGGPEGGAAGLVVAVSGGPDSVALARAALAAREPDAPLVLAHLNHRLRGEESDADEEFVAGLHAALSAAAPNVHLARTRLDVAASASATGENLEAEARRLRYRWLAEVARSHGLRRVATGHTADDQAETVLHRLLRGAGLQGLRGIAARRELEAGVEVVRPLLRATRADVLAYLGALGQPYRHDSSNDCLDRTRNRIRHELLPHLAQRYNPAVVALLGRLAEQADEAWRAERDAAAELLRRVELPRAGALLIFDRPALASAPRRLVRAVLRLAWEREGWPVGGMGYEDWQRLADLVQEEAGAADLPGRVRARCRGRVLQLGRNLSE